MISELLKALQQELGTHRPFVELIERLNTGAYPVEVEGVHGGFLGILAQRVHEACGGPVLVVTPTEQGARELLEDLQLFLPAGAAVLFPWLGTLPYAADSRPLRRGEPVDPVELAGRLQRLGYLRVPRVSLRGEFALRGEVADILPFGEGPAARLVLDVDRVAEIRLFDPVSQASTNRVEALLVGPTREVLIARGEEVVPRLRARLLAVSGMGRPGGAASPEAAEECLESLLRDPESPGAEYLFPLCFEQPSSLLDYLAERSLLVLVDPEGLASGSAALRKEYLELYRKGRSGRGCLPPPRQILLDFPSLAQSFRRQLLIHALKGPSGAAGDRIRMGCDPARSFFANVGFFREEMANLISAGYRVFVFAEYAHQAERLRHLLGDLAVTVLPEGISRGFSLPALRLLVVQENEIFGRKRRIPRSIATVKSQVIDSFVDLSPGDYVVHVHHGIGLFNGIERIRAAGNERDYICLQYGGQEKVFLPIEQVNLIQRYVAQEGRRPKLDTLGGRGWQSKKERVRRSVQEMARRLIALYSARSTVTGFAFAPDSDWQSEFEARFPYQETEDQLRAIEEVKADMESSRPMDRLICGDVGYGKTEVALRAAFKAVMSGRQVAYLAPTTILAEQHFETFSERFKGFPVVVEMLSRFRGRAEQNGVVRALEEGKVDVVIGTHRLLQADVRFKNLGLVVVDEEQRFGVKDKERLKELKTSVDCLTLTATPIPRTLHMSLMRIRDMSIIETPPQNRQPVETFIEEFDEEVVARAVRRELARGGQVYYLHNRVESIQRVQAYLHRLLPEVRVAVAHGQMDEEQLEEVMHGFIRGDTQVLLSTTIIENGLDIPNVNTIIIDRADIFGVAQLYQLRGRVGRSDTPAFAYLFYPEGRVVSELAMKRLRIISDFTDLGSGFKIALKDLEIRGAGNLLGREQHGDILAVGLDMYLKLLDEAIRELKLAAGEQAQGPAAEGPEAYLELEYTGYVPDSYVCEPMEKMDLYKRIAGVTSQEELAALEASVEDRFGPIPEEVLSLFAIAEIRILCRRLYISALRERSGTVTAEFSRLANVSVDRVLTLIRDSGGSVALDPKRPNCLIIRTGSIGLKEKSEFISDRLSLLL